MTPLLQFYFGSHPDHRGRLLAEIVEQDDHWLEVAHDYIQWLFPLTEFSRVVPGAPTLSPADIQAFRKDPLLQDHLRVALRRMLRFYGLVPTGDAIGKGPNWAERRGEWFDQPTHNNHRLTRILKSLSALGLAAEARALLACLQSLCATEPGCGVPADTQAYWAAAVVEPKAPKPLRRRR